VEITGNVSAGSISVGHDAQIRGNLLSGDIVTSYGSILEGNTCAGISLKPDPAGGRSGPSRVLNNTCNNLTLEDGDGHLVLGNRIGAVLSVTSGSQHTISDNWVGFEDTDGGYIEAVGALDDLIIQGNHIQGYNNAGTHYGIRITGGTGHTVSGNIMVWFDDFFGEINLTGCSESRVTGNRSAAIKVSQNCIVADNEVLADNAPVTGDLIWVSNTGCTVTGNRALGVTSTGTLNPATDADPNQAAGGTAVSGNRFSSVTGLFGQATTALQPAVLPGPVVQVAYGLNNVW